MNYNDLTRRHFESAANAGVLLARVLHVHERPEGRRFLVLDAAMNDLVRPAMYEANSPHRHIEKIRTPMLIIHGNRDYRVPVGEALRLWWDLTRHGMEAKFLYFPDENHWILTPGNARIWYETIFAFLAQHVLGEDWQRPRLL